MRSTLTLPKGIDSVQFKMGLEDEAEHHLDGATTRKLVIDHLKEMPDYYTRLRISMHRLRPDI